MSTDTVRRATSFRLLVEADLETLRRGGHALHADRDDPGHLQPVAQIVRAAAIPWSTMPMQARGTSCVARRSWSSAVPSPSRALVGPAYGADERRERCLLLTQLRPHLRQRRALLVE